MKRKGRTRTSFIIKKLLEFLLVLMLCVGRVTCRDFCGYDVELSDNESKDTNFLVSEIFGLFDTVFGLCYTD